MDNPITTMNINIAMIGAGANTRKRHRPNLQAIADVHILGVCNRSPESSRRVADEFGLERTWADWRTVIADPDINTIVIGTWPDQHAPITITALEAGKHVLTEARMARSTSEARAMLNAARTRPDCIAQIVPSPFTLTADRTIQRLIASGFLGNILTLDVQVSTGFLDRHAPMHWRYDFDRSGFNTISLGIWYEAVARWIGHARSVTVTSRIFVKTRTDEFGRTHAIQIPDHLDVLADMACGAQARFQISSVTGWPAASATLHGSNGVLRFQDGKLSGGQNTDLGLAEIPIPDHEAIGWRVEEEFINAIRGLELVTHTTFADGLKYMEFTEAAIRSSQSGGRISLPLT